MLAKRVLIGVLLTILSSSIAFSQGEYLKKGESGVAYSAAFLVNRNAVGFGGSFGYSYLSMIDFGLSASRTSIAQRVYGYDLSGVGVSPSIALNLKSDSTAVPQMFLSISGTYEIDLYSSKRLAELGLSMIGSYFSFEGTLCWNIFASNAVYLQPALGLGYLVGSNRYSNFTGLPTPPSAHDLLYLGGLSIVLKTLSANSYVVEPAVSVDKGQPTFSLSLDLVLGTKP